MYITAHIQSELNTALQDKYVYVDFATKTYTTFQKKEIPITTILN